MKKLIHGKRGMEGEDILKILLWTALLIILFTGIKYIFQKVGMF